MYKVIVSFDKWNQTAKAKDGDGKESTVYLIGRLADVENTFAVSVPPRGMTMYFCSVHRLIFKIGARCPECTSTAAVSVPVSRLVTPPTSADNLEVVN
jgi:hypothetical protein